MSQTAQQELVFCHECENEWYRDEHGIVCPHCQSEFTEIIEPDNDPRQNNLSSSDQDSEFENENEQASPTAQFGLDPFRDVHPWRNAPDPEDGDINQLRVRSTGPGRISVTGTFYRTYSPRTGTEGAGPFPPNRAQGDLHNNFVSMIHGMLGNASRAANDSHQDQHAPPIPGSRPNANQGDGQQQRTQGPRFTYSSSAQLYPADPNNPNPHVVPVDEVTSIIGNLFNQIAPPLPPHPRHQGHFGQPDRQGMPSPPPLAQLFAALLNPSMGNEAQGDFVFSQEGFDRVVSQLMEQNATGNAPGPASQESIDALPRKRVTSEMLGIEGRGECSICMDEVKLGEEVTQLWCGHWFHGNCIKAWLSEHDTCPHCRKGISDHGKKPSDESGGPSPRGDPSRRHNSYSSDPGPSSRSSRHGGNSTSTDQSGQRSSPRSRERGGSTFSLGITDRIRRQIFGSN